MRGSARILRTTMTALSAVGDGRLAPRRSRAMRAAALSAACREICATQRIDVELVGLLPNQPCVLVANHVSYVDPIAILAHIPAIPLAKAEVAEWPIVGGAIAALGGIFVQRDNPMARARALRAALHVLDQGVSVVNFPEGTTTDGRHLLPFHRGIFGVAMVAGVPVVPIALRFEEPRCAWTGNTRFLLHFWWLSTQSVVHLRMMIRAPLWPWPDESPDDFAARTRVAIAAAHQRVSSAGGRRYSVGSDAVRRQAIS
jgi:lyso-ornithine lipid O-acyltransferase